MTLRNHRYLLSLVLVVACSLSSFVSASLAANATERIRHWVDRLWEERGGVRAFVARAIATGKIPFLGGGNDADSLAQISELADSGLVGLDEMNRIQEILLQEFDRREGGQPSVRGLVAILAEADVDEIALDELLLRIVVPQALRSPEDLHAIWQKLSAPTRRLGADYVRELMVGRLRQVRSRKLDLDEIRQAFPERGLYRDGLLLAGTVQRWAEGAFDGLRDLLSDALGRNTDRLNPGVAAGARVVAFFGDLARASASIPGSGRAILHRLQESVYDDFVTDRDTALALLDVWAALKNVRLGDAERELFNRHVLPESMADVAGESLEAQLEWLEGNVPSTVPVNAYLFALAKTHGESPEDLEAIARHMQRSLHGGDLEYLARVVTDGATRSAEGRGDGALDAALNFVARCLPTEEAEAPRTALGEAVDDRVRDEVLLEILEEHCKTGDEILEQLEKFRTASGRTAVGRLGFGFTQWAEDSDLDTRLATIVRFFPEPSRARDEFLDEALETVARHGGDVRKIRKLQYEHMSKKRRETGPYGQQVEKAKELARQISQRSSAMEKAYVLVAYVKRAMAANGDLSADGSDSALAGNMFALSKELDSLDRKELIRSLLVGSRGILSSNPAERLLLDEIFFSRFDMSLPAWQLIRKVVEGYIYRLPRSRKTRIYLALTDMTGQRLPLPQLFRHLVEKLGIVPIKFAQMLSTRPEVLPEAFRIELEQLCDDVSSFDKGVAIRVIESQTGRLVQELTDDGLGKRIGAGSVKQVYLSSMDGEAAVVKVLRPGAREEIDTDLAIMTAIAEEISSDPVAITYLRDPVTMLKQFERELRAEIQMANEAEHVETFRSHFADDPMLTAPGVLLLDGDVMIEQFIAGKKITKAAEAFGLDPKVLAERATRGLMVQIFRDGFFHGDPHPGNVLVTSEGVIVFIDWGMTGRLPLGQRFRLMKLFLAMLTKRSKLVLHQLCQLDRSLKGPLDARAADKMQEAIGTILAGSAGAGQKLLAILYVGAQNGLNLASDFTMMAKAIGCMEGIAKQLDPETSVVPHAAKAFAQAYVRKIAELAKRPWTWLKSKFSRENAQQMRDFVSDPDLDLLLAR